MNKTQPFRAHHVARALRGVAAAGLTNPHIEVRLPTGATIVIGGSSGNKDLKPPKVEGGKKKRGSPIRAIGGLAIPAGAGMTGVDSIKRKR